jgi:hypothetical protein
VEARPKLAINPLPEMPSQEPQRTAEAVRRILPELIRLHRYESRAVTRRDRAIRAIAMRDKNQLYNLRLHDAFFLQNEPNFFCIYKGLVFAARPRPTGPKPRRLQIGAVFVMVHRAFEMAGVEFIDENGGGPGVRLRKPNQTKSKKK